MLTVIAKCIGQLKEQQMIELSFEEFTDAVVASSMLEQINNLEPYDENNVAMWFADNRKRDREAVEHLVHCMKVVHDFFSAPDNKKFFNYANISNT
jgi:hypothetical protein